MNFSDAEKSESELAVCWYTAQNVAVRISICSSYFDRNQILLFRFQKFHPVGEFLIQKVHRWGQDWISEKAKTNGESSAFIHHITANEERREEKR